MAGYDSYVKLLLHGDGTDASTTITDEAGHTMTAAGSAQIDTAQKKFGTGSILLDGTTDYVYTADSADWYFAANPFTIDFWFRPAVSPSAYDTWISQFNSTPNNGDQWKFDMGASGTHPRFVIVSNGTTKAEYIASNTNTFSADTWYHIALVRNGTAVYIFVDGTSISLTESTAISTNEVPNLSGNLNIGLDVLNSGRDVNGWIEEFRLSKGVARWTSNFTPPTEAYSADAATSIKTINGLAKASVKTVNGLAIASVKTINNLA